MKRVLTGILVLSSALLLASCGDKTTTQKRTTTAQTTTSKKTTAKKTTTKLSTTKMKTTEAPVEYVNRLRFYCYDNELKKIIDKYYPQTDKFDETKTYLHDGTVIEWIAMPNPTYVKDLETALETCNVDMFVFQARYAPKYINTDMVVDLEDTIEDYDISKQFKGIKDLVTYDYDLKGAAWLATPGVTVYNQNVADKVWGEWDGDTLSKGVTYKFVEECLSTKEKFDSAAAEVNSKGSYMLIEPLEWAQLYFSNLNETMYDDKGTLTTTDDKVTIDQKLIDWINDSKYYLNQGLMFSAANEHVKWGTQWDDTIAGDDWLCLFSPTWMNEWMLKDYRHAADEDPKEMSVREMKDSKLRLIKSYDSWIDGGTWMGVSDCGIANSTIYDSICSLVKNLTANKDLQKAIALDSESPVVPNNMEALYELANDDSLTTSYFGGQNVFEVYAKALLRTDFSNKSFYDQTIIENVQAAFLSYLQGDRTASQAWNDLKNNLHNSLKVGASNINLHGSSEDIDDYIH